MTGGVLQDKGIFRVCPRRFIKPGMTIAIEPMITLTKAGAKTYVNKRDGWTVLTSDHCMAAHFEHTVAITDDGAEVLTVPADYP